MTTELISRTKQYAEEVLSHLPETYVYHNLKHTSGVVKAAEVIGKESGLTDDELETVLMAAWLHDTGYERGCDKHEQTSAESAAKLLTEWGVPQKKMEQVKQAILATSMPQNPKSLIDQVLCDADLAHLANDNIEDIGERLRKEIAITKNITFSDQEWIEHNLNFFKSHSYFTPYAKAIIQPGKKKNIKKLKQKLKPEGDKSYAKDLEKEVEKLRKKLDKRLYPERGIETMFRVTAENHMTLGSMADTKANIMISINAIILSVIVSVLFRKLEEFPNLLIPTLMLVGVCLTTVVFAVLSVRPNVSSGKFTREDIKDKKTNLLFFGNFHNMGLNEYDWGMKEMMKDSEYLYGSLIKDIYFNGKVLAKKYRFLRISYGVFMYGLVGSILAFIIALLLYYYPPII
ncbi:MAG: DUF5706 domain-containing protein [Flammeovirgaceae bacterium]|nr:DUF5706 domain-containing protein [Flammeovirgaceae bacterium]